MLPSAFYLKTAIVGAEFLSQYSVKGIEGFLLQTAVHQDMNDLSLLLVLQTHPLHKANKKGFERSQPGG